jgi:hypothetical protein
VWSGMAARQEFKLGRSGLPPHVPGSRPPTHSLRYSLPQRPTHLPRTNIRNLTTTGSIEGHYPPSRLDELGRTPSISAVRNARRVDDESILVFSCARVGDTDPGG